MPQVSDARLRVGLPKSVLSLNRSKTRQLAGLDEWLARDL